MAKPPARLGSTAGKRPLQYGNGTLVDGKNLTEVQTFQRYIVEKETAPESKTVLLDYYRQHTPTNKGVEPSPI